MTTHVPVAVRAPVELRTRLLRHMLIARGMEEEALQLRREGAIDLWAPCSGQEAVQVGAAAALDGLTVVPSYREHALAMSRGATASEVVEPWGGRSFSGWDPRALKLFPYTLVLGAQVPHAVGYALGRRIQGNPETVAVFFGDGASSQGEVSEALNLAAVEQAPVLFLCVNNGWAISKPAGSQMRTSIAERSEGFGIQAERVEGHDPEEVYMRCSAARADIEDGGGPRLLEFMVSRILSHTSSDDQSRYRTESDIEQARRWDPVPRYAARLRAEETVDDAWLEATSRDVAEVRANLTRDYAR